MRSLSLIAGLLIGTLLMGVSLRATPASPEHRIRAVIEAQLDRFRADDAEGAFELASPKIRAMFGSAERFMAIVARGYPEIRRSRAARFLNTVDVHGMKVQRVMITGDDGRIVTAAYAMVEAEGQWRIDGCWILNDVGLDT
ncbi:MAG: DUF4864 domain-containing protein [Hyphomicrobiaceae bacterium]